MILAILAAASLAPLSLHVQGTQILDSNNHAVRLTGVNVACMEWTSDGEGHVLETVRVALDEWKANIVRLPLSQDRWFGMGPEQKDKGVAYRALIHQIVDLISSRNSYAILDLHWNDANEWGRNIGQHLMPDRNSLTFWKDCARTYRNHPAVLFDLYNEPHNVSWDVWLKGGTVTERATRNSPERVYEAVGFQELLGTVRNTGTRNVVIVGGLDWSYDMSGFLKGYSLKDPGGNGIIYANHAYPFKGDTVEKWLAKMDAATKVLPVIVSEWGSEPNGGAGLAGAEWVKRVLGAIEAHGWHHTAWDLHPAAAPRLIADWNYTPTAWFGVPVKQALTGKLVKLSRSAK